MPLLTTACFNALAVTISLAGCGTGDSATSPPTASLSPTSAAQSRLTVQVRSSPKARATTWTLTCNPPGGTHPQATATCQALAKVSEPFKPVPRDALCTDVYGGPLVATVTGTWQGKPVTTQFTRLNGCELHRWDQVTPLLGKTP